MILAHLINHFSGLTWASPGFRCSYNRASLQLRITQLLRPMTEGRKEDRIYLFSLIIYNDDLCTKWRPFFRMWFKLANFPKVSIRDLTHTLGIEPRPRHLHLTLIAIRPRTHEGIFRLLIFYQEVKTPKIRANFKTRTYVNMIINLKGLK